MKSLVTHSWNHALFTLPLLAALALAAAPMQKNQAPGYYRMMLGDFEVTALSDGTLPFNVHELLTNISTAQLDAALDRAFLKEPIDFSVNAFFINTGTQLLLVDTGTGGSFGPTCGKLLDNLRAAGHAPEQVDEIYITHMHGGHVGGLTLNGKRKFPNAPVRAARSGFKVAVASLRPYIEAKRFRPFQGNGELVPGVRAMATPGHTVYLVTSKNETLMLWGDLMHVAAAQIPDPAVTIGFDSDSPAAADQRKQVFSEVAARRYFVGGAPCVPGLGHLRANGPDSYVYVPVTYSVPH